MTDEAIIEMVLKGNTHAFSEIVDSYKNKVFSMVYRFTNDYGDAQDLSQEIFINVFKNLHLFSGKSKFSTWLYRISYNLCIDWIRKSKHKAKHILNEGEAFNHDSTMLQNNVFNVEEDFLTKQRRVALRNAINNLDEKYKTPVILFHYQGLSYEEIGEILKLPVKTVETRLYRARNNLRKSLSGISYGGEFCEMPSSN